MGLKESIKQLLKREHMTQDELMRRLGCTRKSLMGNTNSSEEEEDFHKLLMWVRKFPIRALQRMGYIPANAKEADLVHAVFSFMQIGSIAGFENYYSTTMQSSNPQTYAAWIRLGELRVKRLVSDFTPDRKAIISNLKLLRTNTFFHYQSIRNVAREALHTCGIELIEVEPFITAPTPICAFYWRGSRPVIQFPTTKMDDSKFLEALFHAVAHLLLHPKRTMCLQLKAQAATESILEIEADHLAQDMLLSEAEESELICCGRFNERRCIQYFSGVFHVRPAILVERLQQQGKIRRNSLLNDFKIAV